MHNPNHQHAVTLREENQFNPGVSENTTIDPTPEILYA